MNFEVLEKELNSEYEVEKQCLFELLNGVDKQFFKLLDFKENTLFLVLRDVIPCFKEPLHKQTKLIFLRDLLHFYNTLLDNDFSFKVKYLQYNTQTGGFDYLDKGLGCPVVVPNCSDDWTGILDFSSLLQLLQQVENNET